MSLPRKSLLAAALAILIALIPTAALADDPHAGNSGHFRGSAQPCPQNQPQCPPQGK